MALIERTAYPRFSKVFTAREIGCDQTKTLYRYHGAIRDHLSVKVYKGKAARHTAVSAAYRAAEVMDQQTDLINATNRRVGSPEVRIAGILNH